MTGLGNKSRCLRLELLGIDESVSLEIRGERTAFSHSASVSNWHAGGVGDDSTRQRNPTPASNPGRL